MTNRISRRHVLKVGALGAGLTLGNSLRWAAADEALNNGRSGILVFLTGGPSHQDTFDLKPEAPAEYRGEFQPIETNVPGIEICEHLPQLARRADKYAIVRGLSHNLADHGIGARYVMTGNRPVPLLEYPAFGCVASREFRAADDLPASVAVDRDPQGPGYLGMEYAALATGEKPRPDQPFRVRGISIEDGLTIEDFSKRRRLLDDLDLAFQGYEELDDQVRSADRFSQQAYGILRSPRTREAFDLEREPPETIKRFGSNETGQSLLLACRLIEAGVRFVTVLASDGAWDTHSDNFNILKKQLLPALDESLAALLDRLERKGLFESTAVLVTGEFGRTPKINGQAGRDHWARAMCALLAGGAVRGGTLVGESDDKAAEPAGEGFTPDDLAATFYKNLGIDPAKEYHTDAGRPITLVRDGRPIRGVM
ncbi:MAG: DUF1501 domain-containing protein [Planctomycetales bacterium]